MAWFEQRPRVGYMAKDRSGAAGPSDGRQATTASGAPQSSVSPSGAFGFPWLAGCAQIDWRVADEATTVVSVAGGERGTGSGRPRVAGG